MWHDASQQAWTAWVHNECRTPHARADLCAATFPQAAGWCSEEFYHPTQQMEMPAAAAAPAASAPATRAPLHRHWAWRTRSRRSRRRTGVFPNMRRSCGARAAQLTDMLEARVIHESHHRCCASAVATTVCMTSWQLQAGAAAVPRAAARAAGGEPGADAGAARVRHAAAHRARPARRPQHHAGEVQGRAGGDVQRLARPHVQCTI